MITIFNRAELTLTYSMAQQEQMRAALEAAGIKYMLRTRGAETGGRVRAGVEYVLYVHKADLDAARAAICR